MLKALSRHRRLMLVGDALLSDLLLGSAHYDLAAIAMVSSFARFHEVNAQVAPLCAGFGT